MIKLTTKVRVIDFSSSDYDKLLKLLENLESVKVIRTIKGARVIILDQSENEVKITLGKARKKHLQMKSLCSEIENNGECINIRQSSAVIAKRL